MSKLGYSVLDKNKQYRMGFEIINYYNLEKKRFGQQRDELIIINGWFEKLINVLEIFEMCCYVFILNNLMEWF